MKKKILSILRDSTGSSIVIVIVAIAFVGILGATILWMSLNNFYMKVTDTKQKEGFYNAEMVMEQIVAGLQKDASDAVDIAYADVMQKYSTYTVLSEADAQSARRTTFTQAYLRTLQDRLEAATPTKFDLAILESYVEPGLLNGTTRVLSSTASDMTLYDSYLVLEGIDLLFEDDRGYVSKIHTDIVLDTPTIDFTLSSPMPELFSYALVTDDSIRDDVTNATTLKGSVYGGRNGIELSGIWNINRAAEMTKANKIITDADIAVVKPTANVVIGGSDVNDIPEVWASGINVAKGDITTHGKVYLADDLTISGNESHVKLEEEFYGYGDSLSDSSKSSAIIINGLKTELDMSQLDKMLVAGHSYIGTKMAVADIDPSVSANEPYTQNSNDILMGESIAVKGNQVAYLVPDECIDVLDGVARGSNPMSLEEDEMISANAIHYQGNPEHSYSVVDFDKILSGRNVPLNVYTNSFKRIYCPWNGGSVPETLVYYYLVFDESGANRYFADYYGYKKEKLDQYFKIYTDGGIHADAADFTRINMQGNWMVSDTGVSGNSVLNAALPMNAIDLDTESDRYEKIFGALKVKLISNYLEVTEPEKASTVFNNLIKATDLETYVSAIPGGTATFTTGDGIEAVLTNQNYTYVESSPQKTRLIVSTKDVHVKSNFVGTIIAKGKITVDPGVSLITCAYDHTDRVDELTRVLQVEQTVGPSVIKPIDFFVNGGSYIVNGTLVNPVSGSEIVKESAIDFSTIVKYENWEKQ